MDALSGIRQHITFLEAELRRLGNHFPEVADELRSAIAEARSYLAEREDYLDA